MVVAGLGFKADVGREERGGQFGNQLLGRVGFVPETLRRCEVTREPRRVAGPVGQLVDERPGVGLGAFERRRGRGRSSKAKAR